MIVSFSLQILLHSFTCTNPPNSFCLSQQKSFIRQSHSFSIFGSSRVSERFYFGGRPKDTNPKAKDWQRSWCCSAVRTKHRGNQISLFSLFLFSFSLWEDCETPRNQSETKSNTYKNHYSPFLQSLPNPQ